ncbi:MAG: hypothetical protein K0R09_224 [Clostridiales bacterium]|nr:hypothetical protein [Clostridiales bacterium]
MKINKIAAGYSIFVGLSMIGMWIMFYCTGEIPELNTKPAEIGLHITGEMITAVVLIIGGYAIFTKKSWGLQVYTLSMGMLLYTLIVSPGYYVQRGEIPFIIMFSVLFLLSVLFIIFSIIKREGFRN